MEVGQEGRNGIWTFRNAGLQPDSQVRLRKSGREAHLREDQKPGFKASKAFRKEEMREAAYSRCPPGEGASKENIDVLAESTINQEQRVIVGP